MQEVLYIKRAVFIGEGMYPFGLILVLHLSLGV